MGTIFPIILPWSAFLAEGFTQAEGTQQRPDTGVTVAA